MVRKIQLVELFECDDKKMLGTFPTEKDYDEVIQEDCDVYLPDGTLALVFRKKGLKKLCEMKPKSKDYEYWRWVSRFLLSDQRGLAAGREINTNVEIRLTEGQKKFFANATKKVISMGEALELLADKSPSRTTFYVGKTEEDGLVDLEEIEKWDSLVRKKSTPGDLREQAIQKRNAAKLAWFNNWLTTVWEVSEDKVASAKAAKKRYVTAQPRSNRAYSTVLGAIDRSGRTPYGRLTAPTMQRYDDFASQTEFFNEVDNLLKETMPDSWNILSKRFKEIEDKRYNLFGTCFTSITVNWNFQVAYHYDGNNAKDAVAVLSVLENGSYEGYEFVFPQLRLAFDIRHGDFLAGDNQGLMHAMMPMKNASADAECIMFVFYQRDSITKLDSLECETCRKEFMIHCVTNHPELGTGEAKWTGSFPGMWGSKYWEDYKSLRSNEGYDYTQCSNTHIKGELDTGEVTRG